MDAVIIKKKDESVLYCILSILRNMSFVGRIVVVAEEREVGLWLRIGRCIPENRVNIELVFPEDFSLNGLSKLFLLFRENVIVLSEVSEDNLVIGGRPVVYGRVKKKRKIRLFSPMTATECEAEAFCTDYYVLSEHCPVVMSKEWLRSFFKGSPQILKAALTGQEDLDVVLLQFTSMFKYNQCVLKANPTCQLDRCGDEALWERLKRLRGDSPCPYCEIVSWRSFSKDQRKLLKEWLDEKLDIKGKL